MVCVPEQTSENTRRLRPTDQAREQAEAEQWVQVYKARTLQGGNPRLHGIQAISDWVSSSGALPDCIKHIAHTNTTSRRRPASRTLATLNADRPGRLDFNETMSMGEEQDLVRQLGQHSRLWGRGRWRSIGWQEYCTTGHKLPHKGRLDGRELEAVVENEAEAVSSERKDRMQLTLMDASPSVSGVNEAASEH